MKVFRERWNKRVQKTNYMEKLFIVCTFDCSFQYYEETVQQWVKEQGEGIVFDY